VIVKKVCSVVQVLGLTGYALPHLQDSDPGLWCNKISTLSGTLQNLFVRFCASSLLLQNVGLDKEKDPRLMAEACTPRVSVDDCLRDHLSLIVGLVLGLFRYHDIERLEPLTQLLTSRCGCRISSELNRLLYVREDTCAVGLPNCVRDRWSLFVTPALDPQASCGEEVRLHYSSCCTVVICTLDKALGISTIASVMAWFADIAFTVTCPVDERPVVRALPAYLTNHL